MLNATCQSHPIKMGCCSTNEKSLIVTTINPIWRSCPVHPSTQFFYIFVALKARKTSSLHTIFILKNSSKPSISSSLFSIKYIFPFIRIRYFILFPINTHIDCLNNSKSSVTYIFKATKQGAFESVFVHFLLD